MKNRRNQLRERLWQEDEIDRLAERIIMFINLEL